MESSTFCSTLSAPRTTDHPNLNDIPNGPNAAPSYADLEAANAADDIDPVQNDHCPPPHRVPARQAVLLQVGVKITVWIIHVPILCVLRERIPVAVSQYLQGTGMCYILPLSIILPHGPPPIKHSGRLLQ